MNIIDSKKKQNTRYKNNKTTILKEKLNQRIVIKNKLNKNKKDENNLNGYFSYNNINKIDKNQNTLSEIQTQRIKKLPQMMENSFNGNPKPKNKNNNTINNINHFNSCNYIYLLNNEEKNLKINNL